MSAMVQAGGPMRLFLRLFLLLLAGLLGPGVVASQFASAASTSASTSTFNSYLYCGEQWDPDLGLYFNRARCLNVADSGVAAAQKIEGAGQWATTAVKEGLATASAKAQQAMAGVRGELGYQLDVLAYQIRKKTGIDPSGSLYMVEPGPPSRHSGSVAGATAAENAARDMTRAQWKAQSRADRIARNPVSWSKHRSDYWKAVGEAELESASGLYSPANVARMLDGRAPQMRVRIRHSRTQQILELDVSVELHHRSLPQRSGSQTANEVWNLDPAAPWAHEAMDPYRKTGYELLKILRGPNSF